MKRDILSVFLSNTDFTAYKIPAVQQWNNSDQPLEEKQPNTPLTSITASVLREMLKSLIPASHEKEKA